jgi:curli production assembly/transport component CsgF
MVKKLFYSLFLLFVLSLSAQSVAAQDFVYRARNPAFGGDTFNYQWLQSSATAQNSTKDPAAVTASTFQQDPLAQFQASLQQQLLGQLAQRLVGNQFGANNQPLQAGNYVVGGYQVNVTPSGAGFVVRITDVATGNQTTITVPGL